MKSIQVLLAIVIALSIGTAFGQATKPAPAASAVAASDCRHDHGAEKGAAASKSVKCGPAHAAAAGASKPMHEHGKVHKQQ
ncbi:MAG TPA: hypothetical protein VFU71_03490 [Burkholderiaceae bacterium]|nr:hypothetical protein [Burkholderiaceae bacterium]